jgi:serpin B
MVRAGARGKTRDQLDNLANLGATNATFRELLEPAGEQHVNYTLRSANRLYAREGLALLDSYTDTIQRDFLSLTKTLDFGKDPEQARRVMNDWVANYTNDKITDMFPAGSVRPETSLVLVNAIYFKGLWQFPFDRSRTEQRSFQLTPKASYNLDMMRYETKKKLRIAQKKDLGYRVVEVPYMENQVNMYIILPDKVSSRRHPGQ